MASKLVGAGQGALEGMQTGAMAGSLFGPTGTAIGSAIGAGVGGIGGALTSSPTTELDIRNEERMRELERRMAEGTLGLSEGERSVIYGSAMEREGMARDIANQERNRLMASAQQGAGVSFAQMADAEERAINEARATDLQVSQMDIEKKERQNLEYWGRLAAMSEKEARDAEMNAEDRALLSSGLNEFIAGEVTTSGAGDDGYADTVARIAGRFNRTPEETGTALETISSNPDMMELLSQLVASGRR
jgi:hypothetical protein